MIGTDHAKTQLLNDLMLSTIYQESRVMEAQLQSHMSIQSTKCLLPGGIDSMSQRPMLSHMGQIPALQIPLAHAADNMLSQQAELELLASIRQQAETATYLETIRRRNADDNANYISTLNSLSESLIMRSHLGAVKFPALRDFNSVLLSDSEQSIPNKVVSLTKTNQSLTNCKKTFLLNKKCSYEFSKKNRK